MKQLESDDAQGMRRAFQPRRRPVSRGGLSAAADVPPSRPQPPDPEDLMVEHDPSDDLSLEELDDVAGGGIADLADNTNCQECNTNCAASCGT
jgi:hypothetical protein